MRRSSRRKGKLNFECIFTLARACHLFEVGGFSYREMKASNSWLSLFFFLFFLLSMSCPLWTRTWTFMQHSKSLDFVHALKRDCTIWTASLTILVARMFPSCCLKSQGVGRLPTHCMHFKHPPCKRISFSSNGSCLLSQQTQLLQQLP